MFVYLKGARLFKSLEQKRHLALKAEIIQCDDIDSQSGINLRMCK